MMPTPPAADLDLVDGLRAGRRDAFEDLYAAYRAPIYNLCARILGDREEAKDVTQEVFIKAFDRLPAADAGELKLRPWLYRVATNACFNHLRSRRRLDGGGDACLEQAASAVDEFERAQTVALVERSLGEMNERYRTALVLKDLQGLPPEEIAEVMDVSRPAADVLVHRARASFKTVFARLAGEGAPAPAALGLVLLPLGVPTALQAMPPVLASLAPAAPLAQPVPAAPAAPGTPAAIPAAAAPVGVGLLAKVGAALTTKAAIGGAAAALVVGGGVALERTQRGDPARAADGAPAAAVQPVGSGSGAAAGSLHDVRRDGHGVHDLRHGNGSHHGAGRAARDSGDHSGSAGHDGPAKDAGETHDTTTSSHESTSSSASGTSDHQTTTSTSTTTHDDGGDTSGGHDDGER